VTLGKEFLLLIKQDGLRIIAWLHIQWWVLCTKSNHQHTWRQKLPPLWTTRPHNRLISRHNIECVYTDEHRKNIFVVLAKHRTDPWWWFLREPKHVGASVIIFTQFEHFYDFIILCISWNNKKCFNKTAIFVNHQNVTLYFGIKSDDKLDLFR
jgi:hypothetical protein